MKRVYQTRFGGSDRPKSEQGNCFQACVATIFDLPLEQAFDMMAFEEGHWWDEFQRWLKPYGLACIYVAAGQWCGDAGICIGDYNSTTLANPADGHVAVAWQEDGHTAVLHDPNPNAKALGEFKGVFIFVPLSREKFNARRDWRHPFDSV